MLSKWVQEVLCCAKNWKKVSQWLLNEISWKLQNRVHFYDAVKMSTRSPVLQSRLKIVSRLPGDVPPLPQYGWFRFDNDSSGFNSDGWLCRHVISPAAVCLILDTGGGTRYLSMCWKYQGVSTSWNSQNHLVSKPKHSSYIRQMAASYIKRMHSGSEKYICSSSFSSGSRNLSEGAVTRETCSPMQGPSFYH